MLKLKNMRIWAEEQDGNVLIKSELYGEVKTEFLLFDDYTFDSMEGGNLTENPYVDIGEECDDFSKDKN